MRSPLKYLLLSLVVSGCVGPEAVVVSKYCMETLIVPNVLSALEVVVLTDDSDYPYKILYVGITTQRETLRVLRPPDDAVAYSSGYSYWDYCYSQGHKVARKISRQKRECNALRLYFDNSDILYDHAHVVKASYASVTKHQNH